MANNDKLDAKYNRYQQAARETLTPNVWRAYDRPPELGAAAYDIDETVNEAYAAAAASRKKKTGDAETKEKEALEIIKKATATLPLLKEIDRLSEFDWGNVAAVDAEQKKSLTALLKELQKLYHEINPKTAESLDGLLSQLPA